MATEPEAMLALSVIEMVVIDLVRDCRCGVCDRFGRPLRCHYHEAVADLRSDDALDAWCAVLGYDAPMCDALREQLRVAAHSRPVAARMASALSTYASSLAHQSAHDGRPLCEVA